LHFLYNIIIYYIAYTITSKGNLNNIIKDFLILIENQFNKKVKVFKLDSKYTLGKQFPRIYRKRGIKIKTLLYYNYN